MAQQFITRGSGKMEEVQKGEQRIEFDGKYSLSKDTEYMLIETKELKDLTKTAFKAGQARQINKLEPTFEVWWESLWKYFNSRKDE